MKLAPLALDAAGRLSRGGADRAVGRRLSYPVALATPAAVGLLFLFVVPFAIFFVYSFLSAGYFSVHGPLTVTSYWDALSSDTVGTLAFNSFVVGLAAASVTVAVAMPVAYWLRYAAGRLQIPVLFLVTLSVFASFLVRIYAWRTMLGENGVVNRGLEGIGVIHEPLGFLLFSRFAVVVAQVHLFLPLAVLVLFAALRPVSVTYLETVQDLGGNAVTRWLRLILPVTAAPALLMFLFVFVLAASDYVTPQFLGGASGLLLGTLIQLNFTGIGNWPVAAALSILMLVAFMTCYGVFARGLRKLGLDRIRWVH